MPRMRDSQIMFRVYDEMLGEMVGTHMHVIGESFCCGRIEAWIEEHEHNGKGMLERYNDMILMQYTGFRDDSKWKELTETEKDRWYNRKKDWEGKFIWEGDIIPYAGKNNTVNFIEGCFSLTPPDEVCWTPIHLIHEKLKVIGNKFENPELLEENS